jgi:hypothetical protein
MPDGDVLGADRQRLWLQGELAGRDAVLNQAQGRWPAARSSAARRRSSCTIPTRRCRSASPRGHREALSDRRRPRPESSRSIGDKIWIGEEFGPYIIRADMTGKVEAVFETTVDGKPVRSPDHYAVTAATPGATNLPVGSICAAPRAMRAWPVEGRQVPLPAARRPALGCREKGLKRSTARTAAAHPRVRRRRPRSGPAAPGMFSSRRA